jgi:hypothetical protein
MIGGTLGIVGLTTTARYLFHNHNLLGLFIIRDWFVPELKFIKILSYKQSL